MDPAAGVIVPSFACDSPPLHGSFPGKQAGQTCTVSSSPTHPPLLRPSFRLTLHKLLPVGRAISRTSSHLHIRRPLLLDICQAKSGTKLCTRPGSLPTAYQLAASIARAAFLSEPVYVTTRT
eukprot:3432355-Rhodomonas_salina.1